MGRYSHPKASHVGPLLNTLVAIVGAPAVTLASKLISDLSGDVIDTSRAADLPPNPQLSSYPQNVRAENLHLV